MKKIKAFTLSELLVVMVVSTIVVSMAFLVLTMVQKQMNKIQGNLEKKKTIESLDKILWQDFNQAKEVFVKGEQLVFEKEEDTLVYHMGEKALIREKDSFPILVKNKSFFLDGIKIEKGSIDALKLTFESTYTNQELFVYRTKPASFYLNK